MTLKSEGERRDTYLFFLGEREKKGGTNPIFTLLKTEKGKREKKRGGGRGGRGVYHPQI